jgi:hypothetical protein
MLPLNAPNIYHQQNPYSVKLHSSGTTVKWWKVKNGCKWISQHVVCTPVSYSKGPGFKFWTRDQLSLLRVSVVCLILSRQLPGQILNYATVASFSILSNSLFITDQIIWHYTV